MNRILLSILLLIFFSPHFSHSQSDYWIHTNGPHAGTVHDYSFGEKLTPVRSMPAVMNFSYLQTFTIPIHLRKELHVYLYELKNIKPF
ncbi:MAG: hypothetical protein IPL53_04505 [Ignavibacteria bacterium]|nr:hypothetical protein [Ignavibacteria bacterium]